jgi:dimethylhistidine N-methyltransferase/ergothioneine biosynthesis protein EgtC
MCRHLAYVGEAVTLQSLIIDPPHGLQVQAWTPRYQRHGTVNADGFGVGWYADGDPVPARYRRAGPIWADPSFADLARVISSRAVLAAVRSATEGTEPGEAAAAPYSAGRWLFSHNGAVPGWPDSLAGLAGALSAADLLNLEARCDSAVIWALVLRRLRDGQPPGAALAATVAQLRAAQLPGRFNLLLTDGETIAATAAGDTLYYRAGPAGILVASEPDSDQPGWTEVPDGSVLEASGGSVSVRPIAAAAGACGGRLVVQQCLPEGFMARSLRADARAGLTASPKSLPPKWFYDERGSELFDKITLLDEYYPTRAERAILAAVAGQIAVATQAATLVELGSGAADKTRLLLDALRDAGTLRGYVPVDVSESALIAGARRVLEQYPGLSVRAVVSDFEEYLGLPASEGRRLVAFLGSTIGNLIPAQRAAFLAGLRARLQPGDALLLGTDLVKNPAVLLAAYDDSAGVTAAFNKNILSVLNEELGADFDPDAFEHVAYWDPAAEWIEMRLRSTVGQRVTLPAIDLAVTFVAGEQLRTEVSAKFRRDGVARELAAAGFSMQSWWTDEGGRFGLSLSVPAEHPSGPAGARLDRGPAV